MQKVAHSKAALCKRLHSKQLSIAKDARLNPRQHNQSSPSSSLQQHKLGSFFSVNVRFLLNY